MKNKTTAGILAIFLGGIGVHRFYLGQTGLGILYLVFCWTFIPAIVALVDGIIFLTKSEEQFNQKYNKKNIDVTARQADTDTNPYRATHFYPTLAGFQHHNAPRLIENLTPGVELKLKRAPENDHDPKAIEVYLQDQKLGYLPKEYANSFAGQMDNGDSFDVKVLGYDPTQSDFFKLKMELIDLNYFSKVRRIIKDSDIPRHWN